MTAKNDWIGTVLQILWRREGFDGMGRGMGSLGSDNPQQPFFS
jgi:hypothetical protein